MTRSDSASLFQNLKTLVRRRELLVRMMHREVSSRYRQSFLGIAWGFIKPLAAVAIFTFLFSGIAKIPSDRHPYPLFALTGLLPWTLFSVAISSGISSLTSQQNLVTKIYFPREILPLASLAASTLDFLITLLLLMGMMLFFNIELTWNIFFVFPILVIEIFLTAGITLFLALVNVWFRDITHAAALMLQLWMFLTPVLYPFRLVPEAYRNLLRCNPMVGVVEGIRAALINGETPDMGLLVISAGVSVLVFVAGYQTFKACEFRLADVV